MAKKQNQINDQVVFFFFFFIEEKFAYHLQD